MDQELELDLISKSVKGDSQAFRCLVESHQRLAYSIAFKFTRDEGESEDITQEAFIKLWKNISHYKEEFRFKTWLSKIVTNLCLDYLKSARRKSKSDEKLSEEMMQTDRLEMKLEADELRDIVYKLAEQLTVKQKAVFILRDLETMEPDEVCQILQMSYGSMKSNLYYARLKVKESLQKYYNS